MLKLQYKFLTDNVEMIIICPFFLFYIVIGIVIQKEAIMVMFKSLVSDTDQVTNQANQADEYLVVTGILKVIQEEPTLSQKKLQVSLGEK